MRIAVAFLVDRRGWVLLQERDEFAPRSPDLWGMVGGHVEDGEEFEPAAYREIAEETGLALAPGTLRLFADTRYFYPDGHGGDYHVYAGRVDLTDDDIVVGEGRQIVFVDPEHARTLDLAPSAGHFLPLFLDSPLYAELRNRS